MIYAGEGAPSADTGSEGDFYLDKLTGEMHGPKDGNGWGSPISLQGPSGEDGSVIHSGSGSPADSIGVVGDYYLDRNLAKLYGPKTEQGWTSWIFLKGHKGDPGEDGNANVRSSGWTQIPAGDWSINGAYQSPNDISTYPINTASGGWFGLYAMEDLNGVVLACLCVRAGCPIQRPGYRRYDAAHSCLGKRGR